MAPMSCARFPFSRVATAFYCWPDYLAFGLFYCGSFLLFLLCPCRAQHDHHMRDCWVDNFPDWGNSLMVPALACQRVTEAFRYAQEPIGNVLCFFAVPGAVWL